MHPDEEEWWRKSNDNADYNMERYNKPLVSNLPEWYQTYCRNWHYSAVGACHLEDINNEKGNLFRLAHRYAPPGKIMNVILRLYMVRSYAKYRHHRKRCIERGVI